MEWMPESYPSEDDVPYRRHFAPRFQSVFVAFNPFIRVPELPVRDPQNVTTDEFLEAAWSIGLDGEVRWSEICELCGFASPKRVNRALRLTGSKRILSEMASPSDTARLIERCDANSISLPEEGMASPSLCIRISRFLEALGHTEVWSAMHFGFHPKLEPVASLRQADNGLVACLHAVDSSVHLEFYTDYHYMLIAQTEQSVTRVDPSSCFEGFIADDETTDFWGIGPMSD
jgi:hypothetical protein